MKRPWRRKRDPSFRYVGVHVGNIEPPLRPTRKSRSFLKTLVEAVVVGLFAFGAVLAAALMGHG